MIGASKILTVSYGTFSCTLEGFDEPFNTMKAIAEYFRDLAADDRYFGAEPPTPDAAMLHRIAEREIQRRVEAKVDGHGVVLRASDLLETASPQVAPAPAPAPVAAAPLIEDESVAAKLQRIRAAMARSAAAVSPVEDAVFAEEPRVQKPAPVVAAPAMAPVAAPAPVAAAVAAAVPVVVPAATPAVEPAAIAAFVSEAEDHPVADAEPEADVEDDDAALVARLAEDRPTEAVPLDAGTDAEVVLETPEETQDDALLAAIAMDRDVVEANAETAMLAEAEMSAEPDFAALMAEAGDEQHAVAIAPEAAEDEAADTAQPEAGAFDTAALAAAAADAEVQDFASLIATETAAADDRFETEAAEASTQDEPSLETLQLTVDQLEDPTPESLEQIADQQIDEDLPAPAADMALPALDDKLRRARARVIKVRRAEPEASPAEAAGEDDAARGAEREGRTILESNTRGDEDVSRLLRQTNTEMDGVESRRRMSTLAHLKAAVAATVAELRSPGSSSEGGETSRLDRYRADLARVVRPRREGDEPAPAERAAPLVLVSEQRIDRPAPANTPVRVMPRRVSSTGNLAAAPIDDDFDDDSDADVDGDNIFGSSSNFIEFAERLGASDLPDLLEAAAAYTACVEGRPHFTRPHLMRHVAAVQDDSERSREDSMRSFGQLLRQGKIEKVKRGQFAITDSSYFLAEARRMDR